METVQCKRPQQSPIMYFIIIICFMILGQLLSLIPTALMPDGPFKGLAFSLVNSLGFLLPVVLIARKFSLFDLKETFRLKSKASLKSYLVALIGVAGIVIFGSASTSATYMILPAAAKDIFETLYTTMNDIYKTMFYSGSNITIIISLLAAGILPALYEEFTFRGYLQKNSEATMKPTTAIILTALLFTAIHMNVVGSMQLMMLALFLGYVAYKTNCIWVGIVCHALNNIFSILMMNLYEYESLAEELNMPISQMILLAVGGILLLLIAMRYYSKIKVEKIDLGFDIANANASNNKMFSDFQSK